LEALDLYLDRAMLGSFDEVRVVHGHGTGRLKKAVREYLSKHPAVASSRSGGQGEGGDGVTVARLRSA
jgi:DNA mismatch repair protein MutS2